MLVGNEDDVAGVVVAAVGVVVIVAEDGMTVSLGCDEETGDDIVGNVDAVNSDVIEADKLSVTVESALVNGVALVSFSSS